MLPFLLVLLTACRPSGLHLPAEPASARLEGDTGVDVPVPRVGIRDSGTPNPACDVPGLERVRFLPIWSETKSCRDADAFLAPHMQDVLVTMRVARPAGDPVVGWKRTWDLAAATPGLELRMDQGVDVVAHTCAGWQFPGIEPTYGTGWVPFEGQATFEIVALTPNRYKAALSWTGLSFRRRDGATSDVCSVPDRAPLVLEFTPGESGTGGPK